MLVKIVRGTFTLVRNNFRKIRHFFFNEVEEAGHSDRYSTILHVGFKTLDQGPRDPGSNKFRSCYCFPSKPYIFNNIPVSNRLNPNFAAGLSLAEIVRMYGPPGCLTEVEAKGLFAVHYGRDSLMWGCLPDWFF